MKSNPFKDDVYSLGVTFYQIITKKFIETYSSSYIIDDVYAVTKSEPLS